MVRANGRKGVELGVRKDKSPIWTIEGAIKSLLDVLWAKSFVVPGEEGAF